MKTKFLLLLASLMVASATYAQNDPAAGIVESTDPGKIAAIEKRAQELADKPQAQPAEQAASRPARAKRHHGHKAKPAAKTPKPDATNG